MIYTEPVNTVEETVIRAIEVLETNGWTKGFAARDENNMPVMPNSDDAVKFCVYGSICVSNSSTQLEVLDLLSAYILGYTSPHPLSAIFDFNDSCQSKQEVIKVLKDFLKTQHGK